MTIPLIEFSGVWFHYSEGKDVLREIFLSFQAGEFVALVGQNGAGKTTCAKLINGLLKPTAGEVRINGERTEETPSSSIARTVGYTYQNPDHQIWSLHVEDELAFGPQNLGMPEDEIARQVAEALDLADLTSHRQEYTFSLGWGQRQKLAVASIVAMRPEVIIVDEPTTGLDWDGSIRIMDLLTRLNDSGMTVIIITHDMEIVTRYAARVVVFGEGRILRDGPVLDVMYDWESLAEAALRPPQFIRVALALHDLGIRPTLTPEALIADINTQFEQLRHA